MSLNINVMNASQLAAYLTVCYPTAAAFEINDAVSALIIARSKTEFGLSDKERESFLSRYFKNHQLVEPHRAKAKL